MKERKAANRPLPSASVMYDIGLMPTEHVLLMTLLSIADDKNETMATTEMLCTLTHLTQNTIARNLQSLRNQELISCDLIHVKDDQGRVSCRRVITLNIDAIYPPLEV